MQIYCFRWECLKDLLLSDLTHGILCAIGMPVVYEGVRYNCSVFCHNGHILLIRPKLYLANDGNYRELRWFSAWKNPQKLEELQLPCMISKEISQASVPFGDACLSFADTYKSEPSLCFERVLMWIVSWC